MSTLRFRKPSEIDICEETQEDWWSVSKTHKRRWRMAFTAISFTRPLFSLSKKVLDKDGSLLRTLSYGAIDVQRINEDSPLDNKAVTLLTVDQTKLRDTVRDKNFESLSEFGGVQELALILETDVKNGINGGEADLIHRQNVFGDNKYQKPPPKRFLKFVFDALKDITIIILLACAVLSLGFGIKQHGRKDGCYDGGSIILAVVLVVVVSAVSDFKQSKQFQKLSTKSSDIRVEVVREGRRQPISIFDVVVGDIVCLKIGDQIPSDGLFVEGHSLKVDESSMTGESDHIEIKEGNPFMLSGTKVTDGFGFMLVTSVGMNTAWGEMMSSINRDLNEETPLQVRLNKLTSYIGKIGLLVAALVLLVMLIWYFTGNTRDDKGNKEFNGSKTKFDDVMNVVVSIVSAAVTIIVVAIPVGLPLAVTVTLAYSMKCMMADHAMVRKLSSCETMGSATIICTDKTGTLTLNEMKVTEFLLGKEAMKVDESSMTAEGATLVLFMICTLTLWLLLDIVETRPNVPFRKDTHAVNPWVSTESSYRSHFKDYEVLNRLKASAGQHLSVFALEIVEGSDGGEEEVSLQVEYQPSQETSTSRRQEEQMRHFSGNRGGSDRDEGQGEEEEGRNGGRGNGSGRRCGGGGGGGGGGEGGDGEEGDVEGRGGDKKKLRPTPEMIQLIAMSTIANTAQTFGSAISLKVGGLTFMTKILLILVMATSLAGYLCSITAILLMHKRPRFSHVLVWTGCADTTLGFLILIVAFGLEL